MDENGAVREGKETAENREEEMLETQPYVRDTGAADDPGQNREPTAADNEEENRKELQGDEDADLLHEFDNLSASDKACPISEGRKRRSSLSPRKAMAAAAAEDLYADADESRVDSSSTSTTASKAAKRSKDCNGEASREAARAISDAASSFAEVTITSTPSKDMKTFVKDQFPQLGLSSFAVNALALLPETIIVQLGALVPTYLKSAADLDMNVIGQMLDEDTDVKKIHLMMAYQSFLMHQAMGLNTDSEAQHESVSTAQQPNTNGSIPRPEVEEEQASDAHESVYMPDENESAERDDASDSLGSVEFSPYAFDAGDASNPYSTLAQELRQ